MATARIGEGYWTCTKRWALEIAITKAGHKWPAPRSRQPMSGAECGGRILAFLDARGDPSGDLSDLSDDEIELAAGWTGAPGALVAALIDSGWIDRDADGRSRWHDYGAWNGNTLRDRAKKRGRRAAQPGGQTRAASGDTKGDEDGDVEGDATGDEEGASGSESGSESGVRGPGPSPDAASSGGTAATKSRAEADPAEALRAATGGQIAACRTAVAEAEQAGVPRAEIARRLRDRPPTVGESPFEWSRAAVKAWRDDHDGPKPPNTNGAFAKVLARDSAESLAARAKADAWIAEHPGSTLADYRRATVGALPAPQG